jgi:hypothetical protein
MTLGQGVELGPFNLPIVRILIAVGILRVVFRGECRVRSISALDYSILGWGAWAILSSVFHADPIATLINRLGIVYNAWGFYFLFRASCRSAADVRRTVKVLAVVLTPLAISMLAERASGVNPFHVFGGVSQYSEWRGSVVRAQGPFSHPILAGSVGAATIPLLLIIWRDSKVFATLGILACAIMVVASASSGPVLSAFFGALAIAMWPMRFHMRKFQVAAIGSYLALEIVMKAPAYYILARIDVTGSSTSWHRAELINAAIKHLGDWWLIGTNYTRHWISYGVGWSSAHTDVTNYYIQMGIYGGLLLIALFVLSLALAFRMVGHVVRRGILTSGDKSDAFAAWCCGCALFAHAATFISISYFDQSVSFLYLTLAMIAAIGGVIAPAGGSNRRVPRAPRRTHRRILSRQDRLNVGPARSHV